MMVLLLGWLQAAPVVRAQDLAEQWRIYDNDITFFDAMDLCGSAGASLGATGGGGGSGNQDDNAKKIFDYLTGKGMSGNAAAAFIGNWVQESGLDPTIGGGYLAQWVGGRLDALNAFPGFDPIDPTNKGKPVTDLFLQLDFVIYEITTEQSYSATLNAVKNGTTPAEIATTIMNNYERPNPDKANLPNRIKWAEFYAAKFGNPGGAGQFAPGPVNGPGGNPGGTTYSGNGSSAGGCGAASTGNCVNPLSRGQFINGRTDQGVDWKTTAPQPLLAICDGDVLATAAPYHPPHGWPGGIFILFKLTSGPFTGKCVYYAENISDVPAIGAHFTAGQQIATTIPGDPNIELGWASGPRTPTFPYNGALDGTPMPGGLSFARFIRSLGGSVRDDPGQGPLYEEGHSCQ